ncbi:MAG: ComF family protein [Saprospiraceae bacterium]|nr:ComF family protein [Saprospiraceae bacterium]
MKTPLRFLEEMVGLFYPNLCCACGKNLLIRQHVLCIDCQYRLPKTQFHLQADNPFAERFWGRLPVHAGAAMYFFTKGGRVQRLLHALKYGGQQEVGRYLGKIYGLELKQSPLFCDVELVVPVPLHPRKKRQRGYNQSDCFAEGLSESLGVPWLPDALARRAFTATQTRKSRMERLANVGEAFALHRPERLEGKHILLVDDVMTTGATLEACGLLITELPGVRLSMATIAIAEV